MPTPSPHLHPADIGLPDQAIRRRRRGHRMASFMLTIAAGTAIVGWGLFGSSLFSAIKIKEQPPSLAIIAYAVLVVSSVTLVLGLWYLLLAQVERLARIVDANELEEHPPIANACPACAWPCDPLDNFCRHCGQSLKPPAPPSPP